MDSLGRPYSGIGNSQGLLNLAAVSIAGTAAAITAVANTQVILPFRCVIRSARAFVKTGGTAAGPVALLQYSDAGTGTWTTFGSASSGTDADNSLKTFTVTETTLAAGDCIRVAVAAGTAAATPVYHIAIAFTEAFTGA